MDKQRLRREIRTRLKAMSIADKKSASEKVESNLISLGLEPKSVCIYNALDSEVATEALIEYFMRNAKVYLPVVRGEDMLLVQVDENTEYEIGDFGISEPKGRALSARQVEIDLCVTPMLAGDRKLNRLGKGKGYYDRFFDECDCVKVGLCFDCQMVEEIDAEPWDKKMHYIVTDKEIVK
ncbi:MAG: 5-formyltetrahydrofolate cyclo-ligase [Christensenellales bacterium]